MVKESILQEAQRLTLGDRNQDYGHPANDYGRTAAMFSAWMGDQLRSPLTAEQAVMFMVFVKLSRERHKAKRDNKVDAAGYIRLLEMIEERRQAAL
jgi:hypothetical protein